MVVFPGETAVTNPLAETVATPGLVETQAFEFAAVALPVNCDVAPTHNVVVPEIVGLAFTCTETFAEHPRFVVYVTVVSPGDNAVTTPRFDMEAINGLLEFQGNAGAGVPVPVKLLVCPTHRGIFPEMVGIGFTVMVSEELHPAILV